jgi:hypothetical protein
MRLCMLEDTQMYFVMGSRAIGNNTVEPTQLYNLRTKIGFFHTIEKTVQMMHDKNSLIRPEQYRHDGNYITIVRFNELQDLFELYPEYLI